MQNRFYRQFLHRLLLNQKVRNNEKDKVNLLLGLFEDEFHKEYYCEKLERYQSLGLSEYDSNVIVAQMDIAMFFDAAKRKNDERKRYERTVPDEKSPEDMSTT